MERIYKFFGDFITTELDLEISEQNFAYQLLETVEFMYGLKGDLFNQLKKLINDSKALHKEITLSIVPRQSLYTGALWDIHAKTIKIESPDCTPISAYKFFDFLIFELCNSVNEYFYKGNAIQIKIKTANNPDLYAFIMELAEYNTVLKSKNVMEKLKADIKRIPETFIRDTTVETNIGIFGSSYEITRSDSFTENWEWVNSIESSGNRDLNHCDMYRNYAMLLLNSLEDDDEEALDEHEIALNLIYKEVIERLKNGTFNLSYAKKQYTDTLIKAALDNNLNKMDYYVLYQIITEDGQKIDCEKISYFFEISSVIVDVAEGKLDLNTLSENEKQLIHLAFDIIDYCNHVDIVIHGAEIVKTFTPRLQKIKDLDSSLAEKYKNSLYALNSSTLFNTYEEFVQQLSKEISNQQDYSQEVINLFQNGSAIKSMWRHQREFSLFFGYGLKNQQINLVGGVLNIDANGAKFCSPKLICL